jgi:hypothetical protein
MIKVNIKSQTRQTFKGGGSTFYGEPFKSVPPRLCFCPCMGYAVGVVH